MYYNRKGEPIELDEWVASQGSEEKCRVSYTAVSDEVSVSTVWLGLNHGYDSAAPVIFETMIFGGSANGDCDRYCTEAEAIAGHALMVVRAAAS